jgi:DNA-binding SARP family transcriptional activator
LRVYVSRLRQALGAGGQAVVTRRSGYLLQAAPESVDALRFEELVARGRDQAKGGDHTAASEMLREALGLWRGPALADVADAPFARAHASRLEEARLCALEDRLEADLACGRHGEVTAELEALTGEHPLRERFWAQRMVALYRSGRQAEALAVYADTRRLLAEELGVDPRPDLRALQERILRADPGLAQPSAPQPQPVVHHPRPAQLPATVPDFTGRVSFVRELGEILASAEGRVMAVSALAGIGGVGKTTLAVHVAHQARAAFPDGQLYVDLRGFGPDEPVAPLEALLGSCAPSVVSL